MAGRTADNTRGRYTALVVRRAEVMPASEEEEDGSREQAQSDGTGAPRRRDPTARPSGRGQNWKPSVRGRAHAGTGVRGQAGSWFHGGAGLRRGTAGLPQLFSRREGRHRRLG